MAIDDLELERQRQAWLAAKPECVRRLAAEFPIGTVFTRGDVRWHLVGYTEQDKLMVSTTDPNEDYDLAQRTRRYLCAGHARAGDVQVIQEG